MQRGKFRPAVTRLGSMSFSGQLLLVFIAASVIPILAIQLINFYFLQNRMEKRSMDMISTNIAQLSSMLERECRMLCAGINSVIYDPAFLAIMADYNSDNQVRSVAAHLQLNREVTVSMPAGKALQFVTIDSGARQLFISPRFTNTEPPLTRDSGREYLLANMEELKHGFVWGSTELVDFQGKDQSGYYFSISSVIYNNFTSKPLGVYTLYVNESFLYDIYRDFYSPLEEQGNYIFLMDAEGNILSDLNRQNVGGRVDGHYMAPDQLREALADCSEQKPYTKRKVDAEQYIISHSPIGDTGWSVVMMLRESYLSHDLHTSQNLSMLFFALVLAATCALFSAITSQLSRSVRQIVKGIDSASSGDLYQQVTLEGKNELAIIAQSFNNFTQTINNLITELHEQMERTNEAVQNEKNAELQALEAQINPHFLYNTIDTINWAAIEREQYEISAMLNQLASILRYSVSNVNQMVAVYNEGQWLEKYLGLQQKRFSNAFDYTINIDAAVVDCKVHKLLLQPIVENSIVHGFRDMDTGGLLEITVRAAGEGTLEFTIRDNGAGMAPEVARELLERHRDSTAIGVRNVSYRLQAYYGDKASLGFESSLGRGTTFRLTMPLIR